MKPNGITCYFHGDLKDLLPRRKRFEDLFYPLHRRASIKDIVESLGVPHTEVGRIESKGIQLTFHHIAASGETFHIFPFDAQTPILQPTFLRPHPFSSIAFMIDNTVKKLGRNMRMAGLDTSSVPKAPASEIGLLATKQQRIITSRNRELLKCKTVGFGQLIRSDNHLVQFEEVLNRSVRQKKFAPMSRCLRCNTVLQKVKKEAIIKNLEPLTKKYYFNFKKCHTCERIYWQGSHVKKMQSIIDRATQH